GVIKLYISKEHRGDHKIFETTDKRPSITVDQVSIDDFLDDFLKDKGKIDLIKMDIQGAEHLALEGLKHTIAGNKAIIIITEFSPELLRESGGDPENFLDNLISMGFKIRLIDEKNKRLKPIKNNELIHMCKGARYENLFLTRS
ncbi:MAG: FkbM family methyltransferase, partial [Desulfobacterales bacterium]|nr:FkbM family methyltransferase [Desulfobacterales bacterium]